MKIRLWMVVYLLALILTACRPEITPSPDSSTPVITLESPLPPQPSASPVQSMTSEPVPNNTISPTTTNTSIPTETLTQVQQPTDTTVDSNVISSLPDPSLFTWTQVSRDLQNPVGMTHASDGSGRTFVLEQEGRIRIIQDGELLPQAFLDIRERVDCCGERGLLGLAFHPNYGQNGYFYINYTERQDQQLTTVIARYQSDAETNAVDPNSEVRILEQPQPYGNHNGGGLEFGPDGYLYIGLGDGGSAGDPEGRAQSLDTWLGKLLRIDVDSGTPYSIPADNPYSQGGGLPEIWAYGLRNPWRFSFDHISGDLYIGDVGQGSWEEIDFLPAGSPGGANFGWDYFEGSHPYEGTHPGNLTMIPPVAEYSHSLGISVTGGYVYRGSNLPEWQGVYLYGDYGSGNIWGLLHKEDGTWENALLFQTSANITSFGVDDAGEIYLVNYRGSILRLDRR